MDKILLLCITDTFCVFLLLYLHLILVSYVFMSNKYEYADYYIYDFGTKLLLSSAILLEGACKLRNLA